MRVAMIVCKQLVVKKNLNNSQNELNEDCWFHGSKGSIVEPA